MTVTGRFATIVVSLALLFVLIQVWATASWPAVYLATGLAIVGAVVAFEALRKKRWAQRASVCILAVALIGAGYFAYDRFGPRSDRGRIEDACGPHPLEGPEPAFIADDGTVSCGGLGAKIQSA